MTGRRIALVTGATGTIGSAITRRLIEAGYCVYAVGRDQCKGVELRSSFPTAVVQFHHVDVKDEAQVRNFFERNHDVLKNLELLVTCAGILDMSTFEKGEMSRWRDVIDTNLFGTFHCVYHTLPLMKARKKGVIIAIGSRWGESGAPKAAAYAASKSALKGFIKSLQFECVGSGVRPILLSPGSVAGEMSARVNAQSKEQLLDAATLAGMVSFIASSPENAIFDEWTVKAFDYDLSHLY